ncbi:MAG: FtsX-like permease family protein [Gammaproteobacteria bacterium]|nr:FtsX-like permease family protein [Gammaproteobacteria bacterium]
MVGVVWHANFRFLSRHPWQIFLAVLGVALGVAVVVAVGLANTSAMRAFRLSSRAVSGSATDQIIGGPGGLRERLYTHLRVDAGIESIVPIVDGYVEAKDETLHIVGVDPLAESGTAGDLAGTGAGAVRRLLTEPGTLLLGRATARRMGLKVGDSLTIRCAGRRHTIVLAGLLPSAGAAVAQDGLAITDISTAQIVTGQIGQLSRIDLTLPRGATGRRMRARIAGLLPAGTRLESARARTGTMVQMTRAFRTNLTAMSLLALIVGMFLIYNTMTFAVLQRRQLIGMLRAMGVTRREVFSGILVEALFLGAIGTTVGVALGVALGEVLVHLVTRTINDLYFVVSVTQLLITPAPILEGAALGIGATVLASLTPALEASRSTPASAMRHSAIEQRAHVLAPRLAIAGGTLAATALVFLALPTRSLVLGFAVLFMVIVGLVLIAPLMVAWLSAGACAVVVRMPGRSGGVLARFALRGITASLSRTGVAIAALMLAVATTVGVGVMIQSLRVTVRQWLSSTLRADIYVSVPQLDPGRTPQTIDPRIIADIRRIPGISGITSARRVTIETVRGPTQIVAVDFAPGRTPRFRLKEGDARTAWADFDADRAVLVSEPYAYHNRTRVGTDLRLLTGRGYLSLPVAGIFYDYGSEQGVILMHRQLYERDFGDHGVSSLGLYIRPGMSTTRVITAVRAAAAHRQMLIARSNRAIRSASLKVFDRAFAITGVLKTLAVVIAVVGILNALMALQMERSHELAVLRAIGFTPGQIWGLVTAQTGFMGFCAGLLALPVGLALALLLIHVINRRAFGWSMETVLTSSVLIQALVLALAAALVAGLYPGWRMARANPADVLREE